MFKKNKISYYLTQALCGLLVTLFCSLGIMAQNNKGSIIGTVKDPNAAVIANAKIVVTNTATGESVEATSNETGDFSVTNLDPGSYKVTATATGFKTLVLSKVKVETNSRLPLGIIFTEVSGVGDNVVTVDAESSPLAESETSVRGDIITGKEITDLPIPQRNFTLLAGLSPGVTRPSGQSVGTIGGGGNFVSGGPGDSTESTRFRESGGSVISANGARVTQNNFSLDGVDNNESQFGQIAFFPNPDAISEFKIETSVPSAESGRAAGAIINTSFKSGGNRLSGTIYENYQGRYLSAGAARFDENNVRFIGRGLQRTPSNYVSHDFGGTVGGPIFLPAFNEGGPFVYDGRNKSFFFFSYGGKRRVAPLGDNNGDPCCVTVPTLRMRNGDFGELLRPGTSVPFRVAGSSVDVFAPIGTIFAPNGTPIPGNNLANCPTCGAISAFGRNVLNAYPLPNRSGLQENFQVTRSQRAIDDGYDLRLDHKITGNNSVFGRYSRSKLTRTRDNNFALGTSPGGNDLPSGFGAGEEFGNSRGVVLSDTHVFSPTVINDARAGWNKVQIGIFNTGVGGAGGFNPNVSANLGAKNINVCGTCTGVVLLGVVDTLNGSDRSLEFVGDGGPFFFLSNNYNFVDTLTVVRGSSIFKGGIDLRNRRNSNFDGGRNNGIKGNYQYGTTNSGFVSGNYNGIGPNDTGSALANLLLGYQPGFVGRGTPGGPYTQQSAELAFFVQDDWKVSSNLTLNLGVRYDAFTAPTERFDRQSNYNPANNTIVVAGANAPGGRDLAKNDLNNFAPRIGFAYSGLLPDKKLVVRGGYGVIYTTDVSGVQPLTSNPGTGAASFGCTPITNPAGCPSTYPLGRNPFERGIPFAPGTDVVAARGTTFSAAGLSSVIYNDPNRKDAYVHQYNLTAQYEFAKNWLAEIAFVGSQTRNLLTVSNIGNSNDQGGPGSRQVTTIGTVIASRYTGKASYNSFQSKVEKRFTNGLSILSSYTFSKAIDDNPGGFCAGGTGPRSCGPDDPRRPQLDRGLSDLDVRHRFTFANVYNLPIGKGKKLLGNIPTLLDVVIGGWQFNNIVTLQSGPVFTPNWRGGRADIIGDPTPTAAQKAQGIQYNVNAFRAPRTLVFASDTGCFNSNGTPNGGCPVIGNLGRNTFRGESQEFWDAGLFKNFPIRKISEVFNVQVRVSAFNLLNHVNRGTPNGNIEDGNFGKDNSEQSRRQMEFALKIIF